MDLMSKNAVLSFTKNTLMFTLSNIIIQNSTNKYIPNIKNKLPSFLNGEEEMKNNNFYILNFNKISSVMENTFVTKLFNHIINVMETQKKK